MKRRQKPIDLFDALVSLPRRYGKTSQSTHLLAVLPLRPDQRHPFHLGVPEVQEKEEDLYRGCHP